MAKNNNKGKEIFNKLEFNKLLTTTSLQELVNAKFRSDKFSVWKPMITCKDPQKKMYSCNVCNVIQYGDKNVFSHLCGKKHLLKVLPSFQVLLPKSASTSEPTTKPLVQKPNTKSTVAPGPGLVKVTPAASKPSQGSNTQPKTVAPTAVPKKVAVQEAPASNKVTLNSTVNDTTTSATCVTESSDPQAPSQDPKIKDAALSAEENVSPALNPVGAPSTLINVQSESPETSNTQKISVLETKSTAAEPSAVEDPKKIPVQSTSDPLPKSVPVKSISTGKTVQNRNLLGLTRTPRNINKMKVATATPIQGSSKPDQAKNLTDCKKDSETDLTEITDTQAHKASIPKPNKISLSLLKPTQIRSVNGNAKMKVKSENLISKPTEDEQQIQEEKRKRDIDQPTAKDNKGSTDNVDPENKKASDKRPQVDSGNDIQNTSSKLCISSKSEQSTSISEVEVVKNPLAVIAERQKKILCVPISKLLSPKLTEPEKIAVITETPKEMPIPTIEVIDISDESPKVKKKQANPYSKRGEPPKTNGRRFQTPTFESSMKSTEILGLLGVEYVVKMVRGLKDNFPKFFCTLCSITSDELAMHNHLLSYNHLTKYCEKHFPTAMRHYKQYIAHVPEHQVFKVMCPILTKLAIAIEKHHGRRTSYLCNESTFQKDKQSIILRVFDRVHASETGGPSFTHVVDSTEIDSLIENASKEVPVLPATANNSFANNVPNYGDMYPNPAYNAYAANPSYYSSDEVTETLDDEMHKKMVDNFLRVTRKPVSNSNSYRKSNGRAGNRDRSRSKSPERKRKKTLFDSQWDLERKSLSPLRDGDIWQAYRHMVDQRVRELNSTYEAYRSDPEEHPQYNEEWQQFWKRRKDALIAKGINHQTYNYQIEWIPYFKARMEGLYNQDVENIKIKCRERLCLSMSNQELINPKYHVNVVEKVVRCPNPPRDIFQQESNVEDRGNSVTNVEQVNVIHVLRLLTALEDYLGSLGRSITDLLAKALQISKMHPDKLDKLVLTNENCSLLETAKEKFTGLIISKILDAPQERAIKRAINDTESLLKLASEIRTQFPSQRESSTERTPQLVEPAQPKTTSTLTLTATENRSANKLVDYLGKSELAAKVVSSLISQGKTAINQEQLKQIVQVYNLIEQKKQQQSSTNTSAVTFSSLPNAMEDLPSPARVFPGKNTSSNDGQQTVQNSLSYANRNQFNERNMMNDIQNSNNNNNNNSNCNYFPANMPRTNNLNYTNPINPGLNTNGPGPQQSNNNRYDVGMGRFDSGNFGNQWNYPMNPSMYSNPNPQHQYRPGGGNSSWK